MKPTKSQSIMRKKHFLFIGIALFMALLSSCSGGPRKTAEYVVVNVVAADREGYKHNLRNVKTGQPAYVKLPEVKFTNGDHVIMKRTRRKVTFTPVEKYLY